MCGVDYLLHFCLFGALPDPSLTPENLSTVLDSMNDDLWRFFSRYVNLSSSEAMKIWTQSSSVKEYKKALIPCLISTHPALSWRLVANALYKMGYQYGGDSCHQALNCLQQLFPTGNNCLSRQTTPRLHIPRRGLHIVVKK